MWRVSVGALVALGFASMGWAAGQDDPASSKRVASGQTEIHIMVFDRHWRPIDVKPTPASLEVWPDGGSKHSYKLETAAPQSASGSDEESRKEPLDRAKIQARHRGAICGQVREMGPFHVVMVVCPGGTSSAKEEHADKESEPQAGHEKNPLHHLRVGYFRAVVPTTELENHANGTIAFEANVLVSMAGKMETIKGFDYPEGFVESSLDRFVDYELKDIPEVAKLDSDRVGQLSQRLKATLDCLPPLSFKTPEDRSQYEKALNECRESCARLAGAHGADLATIADECREKCKDIMSRAKDAQGALSAE